MALPPRIQVTGIAIADQATAELAVALRDGGMTEAQAIAEAQRIRDAYRAAFNGQRTSGYADRAGIDSRANSALLRASMIIDACHVAPAVRLLQLAELMIGEPILTDQSPAAYGVRREAATLRAVAERGQ